MYHIHSLAAPKSLSTYGHLDRDCQRNEYPACSLYHHPSIQADMHHSDNLALHLHNSAHHGSRAGRGKLSIVDMSSRRLCSLSGKRHSDTNHQASRCKLRLQSRVGFCKFFDLIIKKIKIMVIQANLFNKLPLCRLPRLVTPNFSGFIGNFF